MACCSCVGEREVKSLLVHCPKACEWNGELRSLKDHIQKSVRTLYFLAQKIVKMAKQKSYEKMLIFTSFLNALIDHIPVQNVRKKWSLGMSEAMN